MYHDFSSRLPQLRPAGLPTRGRSGRDCATTYQPVLGLTAEVVAAGSYVWVGRSELQQVQDCRQYFSMSALCTGEYAARQHYLQVTTQHEMTAYRRG